MFGLLMQLGLSACPLDVLAPRTWCEAPGTHLRSVEKRPAEYPDYSPTSGTSASYHQIQCTGQVGSVVSAWSGAAYDARCDRLLIWGGGHNDYCGNEVYAFLTREQRWQRLTDPTVPNTRCGVENSDGTPVNRHTYNGLTYIDHAQRFFALGGAPDCDAGGCGVAGTWTFDPAGRRWQRRSGSGEPLNRCGDAAVYEPVRRLVYYFGPSGVAAYDADNDRWSYAGSSDNRYYRTVAAVPSRHLLVQVGQGMVTTYDLQAATLAPTSRTTSGPQAVVGASNPGLAYSPTADLVVGWVGGSSVYALDLDSWSWTEVQPAAGNTVQAPAVTAAGGTYGRFRYVPSKNVFVVVNSADENVFFYKLDGAPGDPAVGSCGQEDTIPPAPPARLRVGSG